MKPINKEILRLALPSILANITVPIVGMVDMGVAGHLDAEGFSVATLISGITIGTMLFDLLYWNFAFLRVGTGGLTAQAFGRGDFRSCADNLCRSTGLALLISLVLILIQWIFVKGAFLIIDCSDEVCCLASQYFFIRIWAAPATLSLMALRGWFVGMQDSLSSMITDLVVNVVNIVASIVLALGIHFGSLQCAGIGFPGIAGGTVIAQYTGLLCASGIVLFKYRRKVFTGYHFSDFVSALRSPGTRHFFKMNTDLFGRSLCLLGIYIGFTVISAGYGDLLLATSAIIMKILMIFSYFTDGFAYAGEALTGKYIGAGNRSRVSATVKYTFIWSLGIAVLFIGIYAAAGLPFVRLMTSDSAVIDTCRHDLPWLLLMPLIGCAAFTWDGIYIGATAFRTMRNAMLLATLGFFLSYYAFVWILGYLPIPISDISSSVDPLASSASSLATDASSASVASSVRLHLLLLAYFIHLAIRTLHLTVRYRPMISRQFSARFN